MHQATLTATFADAAFPAVMGPNMAIMIMWFWNQVHRSPGKVEVGPVQLDKLKVRLDNGNLLMPMTITTAGDETKLASAFQDWWNEQSGLAAGLRITACTAILD